MHTFRVWAPIPKSMAVAVGRQVHPMEPEGQGWWRAEVAAAGPGSDYGFVLQGAEPVPDPRTPWQPHGVLGLSRLVDHDSFVWTDGHFQAPPLSAALVYEAHIGTFTPGGTFESAVAKLDHLLDLGVTHLELMPVNEFPGQRGWGYDGVHWFAPHHAYGGPEGLKRLVDACHARGLAVLLDVVYNHVGPTGNHLARFGPYFNPQSLTPWGPALNFDGPHSDEVRRFCCDNALMWLRDYHLDGLRLDAVHAIRDTSAIPFLEQLGAEVKALAVRLGRPLVLIPESDLNDPRLLWPPPHGGFGLDAQWNDDFHHALHTVLTGERHGYYEDFGTLADLARALRQAYVYAGRYSVHRRQRHGRSPTGLDGHRFLAYAQNHDQIGNRPRGERLGQLVSPAQLKIAAALVLTSPFVPMLFQGEEWGAATPFLFFTDHLDPELARAVRDGRRREFAALGWEAGDLPDPQARETFERSKLDWTELSHGSHAELLDWHRRLMCLRRAEPSLQDGRRDRVEVRFDEGNRWLVLERGPISLACNFAPKPQAVPVRPGRQVPLLASSGLLELFPRRVSLPAESVLVLKLAQDASQPGHVSSSHPAPLTSGLEPAPLPP